MVEVEEVGGAERDEDAELGACQSWGPLGWDCEMRRSTGTLVKTLKTIK